MHRPSTEDVFSSEFLLLVYRKHAGMGKLKQNRNQLSLILSQLCYIVKIMFSKVYFKFIPWSKVSVVKVQNWHAKTRYQNEVTEDTNSTQSPPGAVTSTSRPQGAASCYVQLHGPDRALWSSGALVPDHLDAWGSWSQTHCPCGTGENGRKRS